MTDWHVIPAQGIADIDHMPRPEHDTHGQLCDHIAVDRSPYGACLTVAIVNPQHRIIEKEIQVALDPDQALELAARLTIASQRTNNQENP